MRIGRYEIIDEIGEGGMGKVRLARDPSGRLVVLKTALRADDDDDERLRDEARVGLRLRHPGLVETIELFEHPDARGRLRPVLVTAYVPGVSLLDLRRVGPLPPVLVCRIGRQLADALDAVHSVVDDNGRTLGVLHRDVTAGNCLLGHDGRARLIDLGIARSPESRAMRTETGLLRGTLRYLAPELFDGGQYSVQSDLWALGVVLWEALLGRPAISGSDAVAVGRICSGNLMVLEDGEDPDPRVARAVSQLLKKNPADRPRRGREVAALFSMLEKALPGSADDAAAQALYCAIGGSVVDALTERLPAPGPGGPVPRTSDHSGLSLVSSWQQTTGPVLPPLPTLPRTETPLRPLPPTRMERREPPAAREMQPWARRTPSEELRDYAAALLAMEKSLSRAQDQAAAAERAFLDTLPVIMGVVVEPTPPGQEPARGDGFPPVMPLPPHTPLYVGGALPDDDETLTPSVRPAVVSLAVPALDDVPELEPLPGSTRRAAAIVIVVIVVVAVVLAAGIALAARMGVLP